MAYSKFNDLKSAFLTGNKQAMEGIKIIDRLLAKNDDEGLSYLLRHHNEKTISDEETWTRDGVDYFIEYFSIISLAHITGYLSYDDLKEASTEVAYYLGNAAVKRYYYKNYPLLLPQVLLEVVLEKKPFTKAVNTETSEMFFHQFLALNQTIDNEDVNQFLWFMDGGVNDNYNAMDLSKVLQSPNELQNVLRSKSRNALHQAVRGFLSYLMFLDSFDYLLQSVEDEPHKSTFWYYHQYWFLRINQRLRSAILSFHHGLTRFAVTQDPGQRDEATIALIGIETSKAQLNNVLNRVVFSDSLGVALEREVKVWRQRR
jgi:hypothetical protein